MTAVNQIAMTAVNQIAMAVGYTFIGVALFLTFSQFVMWAMEKVIKNTGAQVLILQWYATKLRSKQASDEGVSGTPPA